MSVLDDILTKGKGTTKTKAKAKGKPDTVPVVDAVPGRKPKGGPDNPTGTIHFTLHIPYELVDRMRRAAFYTPGETIAAIAERAIRGEVDRLEKRNGKPFAPVPGGKLKGGRPIRG